NPDSQVDATIADVDTLLKPGTGVLWQVYDQQFKTILLKTGSTYTANPAAAFPVNPGFVNFYNTAQRMSDVFYKNGTAQSPTLNFTVTASRSDEVGGASLTINGQPIPLTPTGGASKSFLWPGGGSNSAKIAATDFPAVGFDGLWAPFHLFAVADRFSGAGGTYNMEFDLIAGLRQGAKKQSTVRMVLDMQGAPAFFRKPGLTCVSTVFK
ncbi:MAG TPA: hypothetical protein VE621_22380, partial [Bryobacteraceae bacterium]|nr:hypothetical protein [Bryobacteraceae bacterium]